MPQKQFMDMTYPKPAGDDGEDREEARLSVRRGNTEENVTICATLFLKEASRFALYNSRVRNQFKVDVQTALVLI